MAAPIPSPAPASQGAPGRPRSESLAQTIEVETPELVVLSYTIAGVGSRALAALVDSFICLAAIIGFIFVLGALAPLRGSGTKPSVFDAWAAAIFIFAIFSLLWGYYVLFEGLADGQTPGKKMLRLRVVRDGGYSVTFGASAVRNLIRFVDIQPMPFYTVGILSVVLTKTGKRIGDIVAGTIVVREALVRQVAPAQTAPAAADQAPAPLQTTLSDEEFSVLERFMERRGTLDPDRRAALAAQLATRLADALATAPDARPEGSRDIARLVRLFEVERQARARGVAARHGRGAARERHVLVATRSPHWASFASMLADAQQRGLGAHGEEGVRNFVAAYRDLASDLARLRTAAQGRDTPEQFYLSRLLAGAHNLLYRGRSVSFADLVRVVAIEAPREVRRSWRPIVLAAALLFGPAVIAYSAVVRQPAVAATFIPPAMLDRAEEGVRRARAGTGYIPDPQIFRPTMASQVIANNVQVTFGVFALGVTAGIGSLILLVLNGVSLGGVMGLYASKGILRLLLAFVAPHGVLELTAVCIAGGAGFLLAAALLLPGRRTRRRALMENGGRAIRLVAAAVVLLLVAGTLEGFVSPIPSWPLSAKLAVSGATLVLLVLYLSAGRAAADERTPETRASEDDTQELLALHDSDGQSAPRALISR